MNTEKLLKTIQECRDALTQVEDIADDIFYQIGDYDDDDEMIQCLRVVVSCASQADEMLVDMAKITKSKAKEAQ